MTIINDSTVAVSSFDELKECLSDQNNYLNSIFPLIICFLLVIINLVLIPLKKKLYVASHKNPHPTIKINSARNKVLKSIL